ncbi:hypothetical protein L209DRAFT_752128 [Thermothelomyces heterothallicus CBS 203.75]
MANLRTRNRKVTSKRRSGVSLASFIPHFCCSLNCAPRAFSEFAIAPTNTSVAPESSRKTKHARLAIPSPAIVRLFWR